MKTWVLSTWGHPELGEMLHALISAGVKIDKVIFAGEITSESKLITLSRVSANPPLKRFFEVNLVGVPMFFFPSHNGEQFISWAQNHRPDLIINCGSPEIIQRPVLTLPRLGVLGAHPGALPNYRGCSALEWSVYRDDPIAASCFFLDRGIDTGPVVSVRQMQVDAGESHEVVRRRMVSHSAEVLAEGAKFVLINLLKGSLIRNTHQDSGEYFSVVNEETLREIKRKMAAGLYQCEGLETSWRV